MGEIIGRKRELEILERLYLSKKAEFLAVYGRRRVGKTYLIEEYFKDKGVYFGLTGIKGASKKDQLKNFIKEFNNIFENQTKASINDWIDAFDDLQKAIKSLKTSKKIIIFFDEIPWLATPKSKFLAALDYLWNRHLSRMENVLLIICGSAASWMINKIIYNKGGLYGRLSAEIALSPFQLSEIEEFLFAQNIKLNRKQILELYMAFGGIAKYVSYISKGKSAAQIINELCFLPHGPLFIEFKKL